MRRAVVMMLALASGCAAPARESRSVAVPEPQLATVQLLKTDPPAQCVEVGTDYEMIVWGDFEGARRKLRTQALARGGNYVRLEMPAGGTIYRCPVELAAPPPVADAAPAPVTNLQSVRLMKSDPPSGCTEMGVVAEAIWFGDVETARTRLRQKAAALGANYIRLEMPTTGTAFRCP